MCKCKSTKEWLKKKKCNVLEWPSPIEMLWKDLKRSVHARKTTKIHELKQFCEEESAKIPASRRMGLMNRSRECLVEVIAAQGGHTRY